MNNQVTVAPEKAGEIIEAVIAKGDLAQLTPHDRARYYRTVCESIGLNPLTKPFEYITLNGKLTLYARKETTDQLRKMYGVSVLDMTEVRESDLIIVTVKVRDRDGRTDMAKGAVNLKSLHGEALANAVMKAETKAKRRATLSICGLGFLDESEVENLPDSAPRYTKTKQQAKDLYSALEAEVHTLSSGMQAGKWLEDNKDRLKLLPRDWEDFLRTQCHDLMASEATEVWDEPVDDSKWEALGPVKQAGMLCSDEAFQKFLTEQVVPCDDSDGAAQIVRGLCNVSSRAELATNAEAAKRWDDIVKRYRAWQREPEIIDQVSPSIPAATSAAPAGPTASAPSAVARAADEPIPSAAEYIAQWRTIKDAATNAKQLGTTWNSQKALRNKIMWDSDQQRIDLQNEISRAIEFLKAPAT